MTPLTIHVVPHGKAYKAWADEQFPDSVPREHRIDQGSPGASPDEALGHLIREMWLWGTLEGPVKMDINLTEV